MVFPQYLRNRLSYRLQTGSKNLQIDLLNKSCNGNELVASTVLVLEAQMYSEPLRRRHDFGDFSPQIEFTKKYMVRSKKSKKQLPLKSKVRRGLHFVFLDILGI